MECEFCGCVELAKTLVEWSNKNAHGFYECYECITCGKRNNVIEIDTLERVNELREEMGLEIIQ